MDAKYLFLDYLWDLIPNYYHIKDDEADQAFNRPKPPTSILDDILIDHMQNGNVYIEKPINRDQLNIGLTETGGKIWEETFKVIWENYLYFEVNDLGGKQEVILHSQDKDLILSIFPINQDEVINNLKLIDILNITYWKKLNNCYISKIYFDQDDDDDLWQYFHESDLPKWRNSF